MNDLCCPNDKVACIDHVRAQDHPNPLLYGRDHAVEALKVSIFYSSLMMISRLPNHTLITWSQLRQTTNSVFYGSLTPCHVLAIQRELNGQ